MPCPLIKEKFQCVPSREEREAAWSSQAPTPEVARWPGWAVASALLSPVGGGTGASPDDLTLFDEPRVMRAFLATVDPAVLKSLAHWFVQLCVRRSTRMECFNIPTRTAAILDVLWDNGERGLVGEFVSWLAARAAVPRVPERARCAGRWFAFDTLVHTKPAVSGPLLKPLMDTTDTSSIYEIERWCQLVLHPSSSKEDKLCLLSQMVGRHHEWTISLEEMGRRRYGKRWLEMLLGEPSVRAALDVMADNSPPIHEWLMVGENVAELSYRLPRVVRAKALELARAIIEDHGNEVCSNLTDDDWMVFISSNDGAMRQFAWLQMGQTTISPVTPEQWNASSPGEVIA